MKKMKKVLSILMIIMMILSTFGMYKISATDDVEVEMVTTWEDEPEPPNPSLPYDDWIEFTPEEFQPIYEQHLKQRYEILCSEHNTKWSSEDITGFTTKDGFTVSGFDTKLSVSGSGENKSYSIDGIIYNGDKTETSGTYEIATGNTYEAENWKTTDTIYDYQEVELANPKEAYILAQLSENTLNNREYGDNPASSISYTGEEPLTEEQFIERYEGNYSVMDDSQIAMLFGTLEVDMVMAFADDGTMKYYIRHNTGSVVPDVDININTDIEDYIPEDAIDELENILELLDQIPNLEEGTLEELVDTVIGMTEDVNLEDFTEAIKDIVEEFTKDDFGNYLDKVNDTLKDIVDGFLGLFGNSNPQIVQEENKNIPDYRAINSLIGVSVEESSSIVYIEVNVDFPGDDFGSSWASKVQYAWWDTEAGNEGVSVDKNGLALEADNFEEYVKNTLDRAGKDGSNIVANPSKDTYTDEHEITGNDYYGNSLSVYGPELDYNPKWLTKTKNHKGEEIDLISKVSWDGDAEGGKGAYKVGPFAMDYVKAVHENLDEDGNVIDSIMFAGISGASVITNNKTLVLDTDGTLQEGEFKFLYTTTTPKQESYPYPGDKEIFYIEIPNIGSNIQGLERIYNIKIDFKYMNAGGNYMDMKGMKYTYTWEFDAVTSKDDDERSYTVNNVTTTPVQMYSYGFSGARWYRETSLERDGLSIGTTDFYYKDYESGLVITKEVKDTDGNPIKVEKDTYFEFDVSITRYNRIYVDAILFEDGNIQIVNKDETTGTYTDAEGNEVDPKTVKSVAILEKNADGTEKTQTVTQRVTVKVPEGKSTGTATLPSEYWEGVVRHPVGGSADETYDLEHAPSYEVKEIIPTDSEGNVTYKIDKDGKYKFEGFEFTTKSEGKFKNGVVAKVSAINKFKAPTTVTEKSGTLLLKKVLVDEKGNEVAAEDDKTFKFKVEIKTEDGATYIPTDPSQVDNVEIVVPKGSTMAEIELGTAKWIEGKKVPTYKVTEKTDELPEYYSFKEIDNPEGSFVDGNQVTVTAINTFNGIKSAKIKIVKNLVNKANEPVKAPEGGRDFEFDVKIIGDYEKILDENGNEIGTSDFERIVTVAENESTGYREIEVFWDGSKTAPEYEINEDIASLPAEFEFVSISDNNKGKLSHGETVTVTAKNKTDGITTYTGKLELVKEIVDEHGNPVKAEQDTDFTFNVVITREDGATYVGDSGTVTVTVKEGESSVIKPLGTATWEEGAKAPTYEVTETPIPAGYTLVDNKIENGEGEFKNGKVSTAKAINKIPSEKTGDLKLVKKIYENGKPVLAKENKTYDFEIKVRRSDGSIKTISKSITVPIGAHLAELDVDTFDWKGDSDIGATVESVQEIGHTPSSIEIDNNREIKNGETTTITVINDDRGTGVPQYGSLKITKQLVDKDGKLIGTATHTEADTFYFRVKITQYGIETVKIIPITVPAGANQVTETVETRHWWYGEIPPQYEVEEISSSNPDYKLQQILNDNERFISELDENGDPNGKETPPVIAKNSKGTTTFIKGELNVYKKYMLGNTEIEGEGFPFEITVKNVIDPETNQPYEYKFNGEIKSGDYWHEEFLWKEGTTPTYEVIETDSKGCTANITKGTGDLIPYNTVPVYVINHRDKLDESATLNISKTIEIDGDKTLAGIINNTFNFKVTIYYDDPNSQFMYNGEAHNSLEIYRNITVDEPKGDATKNTEDLINEATGDDNTIKITYETGNPPKYVVEEIKNGSREWRKLSETNNSGTLSGDITANFLNEKGITRKYFFTLELGGYVWNDTNYSNGKPADSGENGRREGNEEAIPNVIVRVKDSLNTDSLDDDKIIYVGLTDENGHWEVKDLPMSDIKEYYVTFEYDGQTYKATKTLQVIGANEKPTPGDKDDYMYGDPSTSLDDSENRGKYLNSSMATETGRDAFNSKFETITGGSPIEPDGTTKGSTATGIELNYTSEDVEFGGYSKKVSELVIPTRENATEDYKNVKGESKTAILDGAVAENFAIIASTDETDGGLRYPFDTKATLRSTDTIIPEEDGEVIHEYTYHASYPYLNNINLGLVERPQADISVEKELTEALVVVNGKIYKYKYGEIANTQIFGFYADPEGSTIKNGLIEDLLYKQIQINQKNIKYDLNLYKSDYYFRASMYNYYENDIDTDGDGVADTKVGNLLEHYLQTRIDPSLDLDSLNLDIYFKYRITVTNESDSYDVIVNKISDYADSSLELITKDEKKYLESEEKSIVVAQKPTQALKDIDTNTSLGFEIDWESIDLNKIENIEDSNNDITYNRYEIDLSEDTNTRRKIQLGSGDYITINLTYRVGTGEDTTRYSSLTDTIQLGDKNNIIEIDSYSTYEKGTSNPAGRVEVDSAPGNISFDRNTSSWYEDDTDCSPIVKIGLYDEIRDLNGLVWEDSQNHDIAYSQEIGDGTYDVDNEETIPDMTTKFVEKITIDGTDYDFIWPTDEALESGGKTIKELTGFDSEITTDSNGEYEFTGIPAGDYVVRFIYGDENTLVPESPLENGNIKYSGQDYKSTTYQVGEFKDKDGYTVKNDANNDGYIDNEWHDLNSSALAAAEPRVSDARDDESRRLEVIAKSQNLNYENSSIMGSDILQYGIEYADPNVTIDDAWTKESGTDISSYDMELKDYYMVANTAKINMDIESKLDLAENILDEEAVPGGVKINTINTNLKASGKKVRLTTIRYTVNNIDFGIEERSVSNIELDKQIEEITLRTSSGDVILNAKYDIKYEDEHGNLRFVEDADGRIIPNPEIRLNSESIGTQNLQALNRNIDLNTPANSYLGFRYLNVDKDILQGATIEIKYKITALNTGEVDRCGSALINNNLSQDETVLRGILEGLRNDEASATTAYQYGAAYLGKIYYQGASMTDTSVTCGDEIVTSKIKKVIDYVDNDVVFSQLDNTDVDSSWTNITTPELEERRLIDNDFTTPELDDDGNIVYKSDGSISYVTCISGQEEPNDISNDKILDSNGVAYEVDETKNNIAVSIENSGDVNGDGVIEDSERTPLSNGSLMVQTTPYDDTRAGSNHLASISLTVSRYYSSDLDIEEVENITEILTWYNDVGRRDPDTVQGNVKPALGALSALTSENDASATEVVTLSPPTGAITTVMYAIQVMAVTLSALTILAGGIVLIKKKVLTK